MQDIFVPAGATGADPDERIKLRDLTLTRRFYWQAGTHFLHEGFCKPEISDVVRKDGIELCIQKGQPPREKGGRQPASSRSYRLAQEFFPTSTGYDLSFSCQPGANFGGFNCCDTALTINNDMALTLQFYPPRKGYDEDFPRRVFILVQAIRDAILRASVPEYSWK